MGYDILHSPDSGCFGGKLWEKECWTDELEETKYLSLCQPCLLEAHPQILCCK